MRMLRAVPGAGLWIVASVLGLVGVLLCVTVILLPVGIPLVKLAGRFFSRSVQLMLPRALTHPVDELTKAADKRAHLVRTASSDVAGHAAKRARKFDSAASDTVDRATKRGRKAAHERAQSLTRNDVGFRSVR